MPRILQLTNSISRRGGGVAESLRCLTRELLHAGDAEIRLAAGEDAATAEDLSWFPGLVPRTFPIRRIGTVDFSPALTRFLRQETSDLVHLHGVWGLASRSLSASLRRVPAWMVSAHGMLEPWAMRQGGGKRQVAWRLWDGAVLGGAACLHALSDDERQSFRMLGLTNPVAVIPNGVDIPERCVSGTGSAVLYLGRIHPKKGLAELLRAWALLPEPPPLRIAGWDDGGHASMLCRLRDDLGLGRSVEFTGPAFGADKERLYREASAFILPSHSEGLPMTVLEAWAHGLPVLMTDHCHLPEGFARGAALRVEPGAGSIAEGVNRILALGLEERQAMGRRGRELVAESFSWPTVARQHLAVYQWLLGGPKPACVTER